jgi:hypothetical protein
VSTPVQVYNEIILWRLANPTRWSYARYVGALSRLHGAYQEAGFPADEARLAMFLVLSDWKKNKDSPWSSERFRKPLQILFAITEYKDMILESLVPRFIQEVQSFLDAAGDLISLQGKDRVTILVDPELDVAKLVTGATEYVTEVGRVPRRPDDDPSDDPWKQWFTSAYYAVDWKKVVWSAGSSATGWGLDDLLSGASLTGYHTLSYGHHALTFGSTVVTPSPAEHDTYWAFKSRAVLQRLADFGSIVHDLPDDNRVMQAIKAVLVASVDEEALETVNLTMLGVSALYGPKRWVTVDPAGTATPFVHHATALVDAADEWGMTPESHLALLTIAHLAGRNEVLTRILTDRRSVAIALVAGLADA